MTDSNPISGRLIEGLHEETRAILGRTILDGLKTGRFTFTNPVATEGGDYDQTQGDYTQSGGGNHNQGGGGYNQSKMLGNIGRLDVQDLAKILSSVRHIER